MYVHHCLCTASLQGTSVTCGLPLLNETPCKWTTSTRRDVFDVLRERMRTHPRGVLENASSELYLPIARALYHCHLLQPGHEKA